MSLTKDELTTLSKLLDEALAVPEAERDAWFARLSDQHASLRSTLSELLTRQAGVETDDFLKTLPKLAGASAATTQDVGLQPGVVVKGYRLIREIGHGGMSSVWLAERVDGAMQRTVALKLPFAHLQRTQYIERFARERDILAGLAHPNIARLYDAGVTPLGQPFLAMEYIEGVPLVEHCDTRRLGVRARLDLFSQVLAAIQYAHSRLVIHRDLKPSNILVTATNQVALLDFGIAKLIVDGAAKETELTQFGGRALTLNYASPEQIAGQPLSTAADVYSLGVVLYEVLTGALPYKIKRDSRGALEEAILGGDPLKPSQAITTTAALQRASTSNRLAKMLSGDLDTIVLKALDKLPSGRYTTAQSFDEDLRRYLNGEAVLAQPPSLTYRAKKFLVRNRLPVGTAGMIVAAAIAATAISVWQARLAEREARRATAVQEVLLDLFRTNTDAQDNPVAARDLTARQLLDIEAARIGENLKADPELQAAVLDTLQSMYWEVGLDDKAAAMESRRIDALKRAYGPKDSRVASAILDYADSIESAGDQARSFALLKEAENILDANGDGTSIARGDLLLSYARLNLHSRPLSARQFGDRAVALLGKYHPQDALLQTALNAAGRAHYHLGDYLGAKELHLAAIRDSNQTQPPPMSKILTGTLELADVEGKLGEIANAEAHLRAMLEMSRKRNGELHVDTLHVETRLGALLHASSRRAEGRLLLAKTVHALESGRVADNANLAGIVRRNWGLSLFADGRLDEAAEFIAASLEREHRIDRDSIFEATALHELGELHTVIGRYDQARQELDRALTIWLRATAGGADPAMSNPYVLGQARLELAQSESGHALELLKRIATPKYVAQVSLNVDNVTANLIAAQAYLQLGRSTDARLVAQQALDLIRSSPNRTYYQTLEADALLRVGQAENFLRDHEMARANLERAVALRSATDDPTSAGLAEAQIALADCLLDSGNRNQATRLLAKARAIHAVHKELGEQFRKPLRELQARVAMHPS